MPLKVADVEMRWEDDVADHLMPLPESLASSMDGIALNLQYVDYREATIADAEHALAEEAALLEAIQVADWDSMEAEEAIDENWEGLTSGLDAGMGAIVFCLAAIGATPISSCNGGLVGVSHHASDVPHVLFTAPPVVCRFVLAEAKAAGVGLIANGLYAELFTDQLSKFHSLARRLISNRR